MAVLPYSGMRGTTGIHDLRIDCIIGIYPHERVTPQPIIVHLEMDYDFAPAAASDHIADVIDYDTVVATMTELAQGRKFQLLEAMVEVMAAAILASQPRVDAVRLEIRKPAAVPGSAGSFVRVERQR
jgi:7,8-dihydroneopterin aldolase/epimerase/oxygenase